MSTSPHSTLLVVRCDPMVEREIAEYDMRSMCQMTRSTIALKQMDLGKLSIFCAEDGLSTRSAQEVACGLGRRAISSSLLNEGPLVSEFFDDIGHELLKKGGQTEAGIDSVVAVSTQEVVRRIIAQGNQPQPTYPDDFGPGSIHLFVPFSG